MVSKISIPLKKLSKSSLDLANKSFDSNLPGEWQASWEIKNVFLNTYIAEKFKDILHIVPFVNFLIFYDAQLKKIVFRLGDYATLTTLYFDSSSFEPYLKKFRNTKRRFTFFPISTAKLNESGDGLDYHGVSALYDKLTNKVEIFDSIGSDFSYYTKTFKDLFSQIYGKDIKIIYLIDRCVAFGNLEVERCYNYNKISYMYNSEGFCAIWVLWFLELRLSNPDTPKEKLVGKALKRLKQGNKVCELLRGYAQFVEKIFFRYSLVRTSSNLIIRPNVERKKSSIFVKKDYNYLYIILGSLVGSIGALSLLNKLKKK